MTCALDALRRTEHAFAVRVAAATGLGMDDAVAVFFVLVLNALHHPATYLAKGRVGNTNGNGPINLAHVAATELLRQLRGGLRIFGQQQHTARILVEPVDKDRAMLAIAQRGQHAINMAALP